ncbi:hypothetical protein M2284_000336 [Rhodococcus sp. LBL1]|nr:hypothetical protein [Rhodococcus sp. LBL1]MDH6681434.1 hypothetical protein [Rhodococcus sp. LBL2]
MQWGRNIGAAACLAAVVVSGSACGSTVDGTAKATGGEMVAAHPSTQASAQASPRSSAAPSRAPGTANGAAVALPTCAEVAKAIARYANGYKMSVLSEQGGTMCSFAGKGEFTVSVEPTDATAEEVNKLRPAIARSNIYLPSKEAEAIGGYLTTFDGVGTTYNSPRANLFLFPRGGASFSKEDSAALLVAVRSTMAN